MDQEKKTGRPRKYPVGTDRHKEWLREKRTPEGFGVHRRTCYLPGDMNLDIETMAVAWDCTESQAVVKLLKAGLESGEVREVYKAAREREREKRAKRG